MRKNFIQGLIVVFFIVGGAYPALANGPANSYKVTITTMELYNGSSWVTVSSGSSTTIDIASATSGGAAGNFFSGLSIPDGTYSQVRATPSATFVIKGNDGSGRYTTATNGPNSGWVFSTVASAEDSCTVTVASISAKTTVLSSPITVTGGVASHKVRVSFDTSTAIQYNAGANELFPSAPTVTITTIAL